MAELTFKSPGVSLREIDFSQPTAVVPSGIPAGVIGQSLRGPAFVPVTLPTFTDFVAVFGNSDGKKLGPLAVREWLRNAGSLTYVKTLGAGDTKTRTTSGVNAGRVNNAGFVVGAQQVQGNGYVGRNAYNEASDAGNGAVGPLGRTYFLTAFMSESAGTGNGVGNNPGGIFNSAGLQNSRSAIPIIRGVLMAPSGVVLSLSSNVGTVNNTVPTKLAYGVFASGKDAGSNIGTVNLANGLQEFVMYLNGFKNSDQYLNIVTASLDPQAGNYFANVLNKDPAKIEQAGHCLYAHYDIWPSLAVVTGTGRNSFGVGSFPSSNFANTEPSVMLLTGTAAYNSGSAGTAAAVGVPNFEGFEDRFTTAFTPYVISQKFGSGNQDLFRFFALSDGEIGSREIKITISNIAASPSANYKYGTFTVEIRKFDDTDSNKQGLETWGPLSLDPSAENFIAKKIGDLHTYYDFDQPAGKQRLVVEGDYPNASQYVRVELSQALKDGAIDESALPTGFRGVHHLLTAGNTFSLPVASILTGSFAAEAGANEAAISKATLSLVSQPPIPMRESLATGVSPKKVLDTTLTWGVQYEAKLNAAEPNGSQLVDTSILSHVKYFPLYHTLYQNPSVGNNAGVADIGTTVFDSDRFNNNLFSLERVEVITSSANLPNPTQWAAALYRRNGQAVGSLTDINNTPEVGSRLLEAARDFADKDTQGYLKFTLPLQGGFDGVNIFNSDKANFSDNAVLREMLDVTNQFGVTGPTVAAYRKAVDVLKNKTDVDIQLLAIPGVRDPGVTDYAIASVEKRFDALYIMDIEQTDDTALIVTSSLQNANSTTTSTRFKSRGLDTSFAAAYFPDVTISDPATRTQVTVPPSVVVLGAMSLNDSIGFPWFAPAGFTRGALSSVLSMPFSPGQDARDTLQTANINPIAFFVPPVGTPASAATHFVFGQRTLQAAQTALTRVNVRRLLIDIRRKVKNIANSFIFEPNRASTLAAFNAAVVPIMASIQQQQGVERFSVRIDTSTTTQADVENNTIRGKIYLQPTKSVEFISVDFVVGNQI